MSGLYGRVPEAIIPPLFHFGRIGDRLLPQSACRAPPIVRYRLMMVFAIGPFPLYLITAFSGFFFFGSPSASSGSCLCLFCSPPGSPPPAQYLGGQLFHFFHGGACAILIVAALSMISSSSSSSSSAVPFFIRSIRCPTILSRLPFIPGLKASAAIVTFLASSLWIAGVARIAG